MNIDFAADFFLQFFEILTGIFIILIFYTGAE